MAQAGRYWVLLAAAGGGSRMNAARPKQYLPLRGRALIEWSLSPFLAQEWVDGIVVVLAADDRMFAGLPIAGHPRIVTVTGGQNRADSVAAGLAAVTKRAGGFGDVKVLVHDAARPCVTVDEITGLRDAVTDEQGGLLALPATDTLKRERLGRCVQTEDRSNIWRAQTPQLFGLRALSAALADGMRQGEALTDEASAMERAGCAPKLVRGLASNLKVTYPEDLALAEFWLARRAAAAQGMPDTGAGTT